MTAPIGPGMAFGTVQKSLFNPTQAMGVDKASAANFQNLMSGTLQQVAELQTSAQSTIQQGITGGDLTLAESTIAVREADIALRLMMQIQNKLVATWNELKGMQV